MRRSLVALFAIASASMAQFCSTDPQRSGCWLCQGGFLLNCLETAQNATLPACGALPNLADQATCLCQYYTTQAICWATGVQCAEWISMQVSADKACGFAAMLRGGEAADAAATSTLVSISSDQLRVSSSIWHNDAGTDIPTATDDINAVTRTKTATQMPTPAITTSFPLATAAVPIDASPIALVFDGVSAVSATSAAASSAFGVSSSRPIDPITSTPSATARSAIDNGIIGLLTAVPPSSTPRTGAATGAPALASTLATLALLVAFAC